MRWYITKTTKIFKLAIITEKLIYGKNGSSNQRFSHIMIQVFTRFFKWSITQPFFIILFWVLGVPPLSRLRIQALNEHPNISAKQTHLTCFEYFSNRYGIRNIGSDLRWKPHYIGNNFHSSNINITRFHTNQ